MQRAKMFGWWFGMGSATALSVVMVQGGLRELMQTTEPLWEARLFDVLTTVVGGGLLAGCIALIMDRIKKP